MEAVGSVYGIESDFDGCLGNMWQCACFQEFQDCLFPSSFDPSKEFGCVGGTVPLYVYLILGSQRS